MFCHLETLSSSLWPSTCHLTQLAATTSQGDLFRPILPPDLTKYLDNYRLGGDLLLNLHMTREDDRDSFLFRRRFEAVPVQVLGRLVRLVLHCLVQHERERLQCVSEEEALLDLFTFLETAGLNIILVGKTCLAF